MALTPKTWQFVLSSGMAWGMIRNGLGPLGLMALLSGLSAILTAGCGNSGSNADLSKTDDEASIPSVPPPPEDGPRLGSIANMTPILEKPTSGARPTGWLHAGGLVARSTTAVRKTKDCDGGYYAVFPRGYVCLNQGATVDLAHPTLAAMAIQPALDQTLPYTYGRTRTATALLERDPANEGGAREISKLASGSSMAIVGSWTAKTADSDAERLGLLTNGRFVRVHDLEAIRPSSFVGTPLAEGSVLPVAFIVKRGVWRFKAVGEHFEKAGPLDYHATIAMSGKYRTLDGIKFWAMSEGDHWVRDRDVTVLHKRSKYPDFANDGQRWLDVGVVQGTLVAYEGKRPILATLASCGRDRLADAASLPDAPAAVTKLGTFEIVAKHVTLLSAGPERAGERYAVYDVPWALELSSGQVLHGAYWHDRFGIEHGPGDIMLSPADAHTVFQWATPALPRGWHATTASGEKTLVLVHK